MSTTNQRSVKGSGSVRTWWCFRLMTARGYIKYSLAVRLPRDCLNCSPLHDTSHHMCFSRARYSPHCPCYNKNKCLLTITYPMNREFTGCHITTPRTKTLTLKQLKFDTRAMEYDFTR